MPELSEFKVGTRVKVTVGDGEEDQAPFIKSLDGKTGEVIQVDASATELPIEVKLDEPDEDGDTTFDFNPDELTIIPPAEPRPEGL